MSDKERVEDKPIDQNELNELDKQTRKRDREASVEPKADHSGDDLAAKRGKTELNEQNINQIRDKVEDIDWHKGENDVGAEEKQESKQEQEQEQQQEQQQEQKQEQHQHSINTQENEKKPKQSTFASFASTASPFASSSSNTTTKQGDNKDNDKNPPTAFSAFAKSSSAPKTEDNSSKTTFDDKLSSTQGESLVDHKHHLNLAPKETKTGEEDEQNVFQIRSKLYILHDKEGNWKERGVGLFKLNKNSNRRSRLVMRADGVLRVILNVALFPKMPVQLAQDKFVRFSAPSEDNRLEHFTVKFGNAKLAEQAYKSIMGCVDDMKEEEKEEENEEEKEEENEEEKEQDNNDDNKSVNKDNENTADKV
ncbi:hypothetical protein E3P98_02796 [Wallemia ichthyophaga]|nr:hypothetical protein E3P98_02796 [Wallemia ichthyophaga]